MAEYMISILGDKLYVRSVDEKRSRLPSPDDLKMKILIKVKLKVSLVFDWKKTDCRVYDLDVWW